ncbi:MAG: hypothetical protein CL681_25370, partial [Blastopirellula sp.]|nr:hypothetical protein [Blastopirellula sp.]
TNGTITNFDPATGAFNYEPNQDFNGSDSFVYSVNDGTATPVQGTVNITVNAVNDAPTANNTTLTTDEDVNITNGDLAALTNDVDADTLTYAIVTQPINGTITNFDPATGAFHYEPDAEYNGSDSFVYSVSDGVAAPVQGTVNITVDAVDDAPIANDDTLRIFTRGGTQSVVVIVNDLAGPLDSNGQESEDRSVLQITGNTAPTIISTITPGTGGGAGTLVPNGNTFEYTPPEGFEGTVTFTYTLSDGSGTTDTAEVTLNIRNADPSTVTGVVYADYNNNGVQDPGEPGINNVTVTLTGNDDFGEVINQTATTDINGVYLFDTNGNGDELAPSSTSGYTLTVGGMANLNNGTHSTEGADAVADDDNIGSYSASVGAESIVIDMSELGGVNAIGNFAKRSSAGWLDLDGQWDTVANDNDDGFLYATNTSGEDYWNLLLNNFGVHSIEINTSQLLTQGSVTVSIVVNQGESAQVRVIDMTSNTSRMYFHAVDNPRSVNDFVLRFEGTLQDFLNLQASAAIPALEGEGPVSAEDLEAIAVGRDGQPVYERAVDAAFADGLA